MSIKLYGIGWRDLWVNYFGGNIYSIDPLKPSYSIELNWHAVYLALCKRSYTFWRICRVESAQGGMCNLFFFILIHYNALWDSTVFPLLHINPRTLIIEVWILFWNVSQVGICICLLWPLANWLDCSTCQVETKILFKFCSKARLFPEKAHCQALR